MLKYVNILETFESPSRIKAQLLGFKMPLLATLCQAVCMYGVYIWFLYLFLNRSFEQLIGWEDRNKLRENDIFVSKELNIASVFMGIHD